MQVNAAKTTKALGGDFVCLDSISVIIKEGIQAILNPNSLILRLCVQSNKL